MDILYVHQHFRTPSVAGGTRSYEFGRRLAAKGHRVHMIAGTSSSDASDRWRTSEEGGMTVHWCPTPYAQDMGVRGRLQAFGGFALRASRRTRELPADVVIASSTPLTVAIPGVVSARRSRAPMVFEVRDVWPEVPIAMGYLRSPISRYLALELERFAYRHAETIVALSPDMAMSIKSRYPDAKVVVVPNSSDLDQFAHPDQAAAAAVRSSRPWLADRPFLLYAGTLGAVNDIASLVDIAVELERLAPEIRILLLGDGSERAAVEARAGRAGVLDRNLFIEPPVAKSALPAFLAAADLCSSFVADVAALHANSANKAFDAFAAGRPLLINHRGWLADLLEQSGAGLVVAPGRPDCAARIIADRLLDPSWLRSAGAAAMRLAQEAFSRDLLFAEFEHAVLAAAHTG